MNNSKTCSTCLETKPVTNFHAKAISKDGYQNKCKTCSAAYYKQNKQHKALKAALRYVEKREEILAYQHSYKKANPEIEIAYRERTKTIRRIKSKLRYQNNADFFAEQKRLYRAKNPAAAKQYQKEWALKNPDAAKSKANRRYQLLRNVETKIITDKEIRKLYQGPCFYCGNTNRISIDHIIPLSRNGRHSIGNLISACKSCNSRKQARTIMEYRIRFNKKATYYT